MTQFNRNMIKIILILIVISSCENTGGILLQEDMENNGSSFKFGNDKMTSELLSLAKAYSERDAEKLFAFYSNEFLTEKRKERSKMYLASMDSLYMKPYKIIPLTSNDGKIKEVIAWSKEERIYKNGSYEKLDLMEQFGLDDNGKVNLFNQWKKIDSVNFGMPYGGKFIGKGDSEFEGRPLVFSNRGEVDIIEKLVNDYNAMDLDSFLNSFADEFTFESYDGKSSTFKKGEIKNLFKQYKSVEWKPISIVPLKIYNTDAASGVFVYSTEKRVLKNGKKWNKDLMELYYFDLDMKISSMVQFAR